MDTDHRVKLTIGSMVVQICNLEAELEAAKKRIAELEAEKPPSEPVAEAS